MSLLEMKHIKKSFDGVEVLKDISLKVDRKEKFWELSVRPGRANLHSFAVQRSWRHRIPEK